MGKSFAQQEGRAETCSELGVSLRPQLRPHVRSAGQWEEQRGLPWGAVKPTRARWEGVPERATPGLQAWCQSVFQGPTAGRPAELSGGRRGRQGLAEPSGGPLGAGTEGAGGHRAVRSRLHRRQRAPPAPAPALAAAAVAAAAARPRPAPRRRRSRGGCARAAAPAAAAWAPGPAPPAPPGR